MKTIKKVEIEPVFVEFIPKVMEQGKVYISDRFNVANHLCLCGCGLQTPMRIGGTGWQLTKHKNGKVSFSPSISNYQYPCKSHYIITKNIANFV